MFLLLCLICLSFFLSGGSLPLSHSPSLSLRLTLNTHAQTHTISLTARLLYVKSSRTQIIEYTAREIPGSRLCSKNRALLFGRVTLSHEVRPLHISIRQHTPAYASIRQHTSAYVSIRQHTSAHVSKNRALLFGRVILRRQVRALRVLH